MSYLHLCLTYYFMKNTHWILVRVFIIIIIIRLVSKAVTTQTSTDTVNCKHKV